MLRLACLFAIASIISTALAQQPVTPHGRITGTVYCDDTHKPARAASVSLETPRKPEESPDDFLTVQTDANGHYEFKNLEPGVYWLRTSLTGYMSATSPDEAPVPGVPKQAVVTVSDSEPAVRDIALERGAALTGHVVYDDGSPAIDVRLRVEDALLGSDAKASHKDNQPYISWLFSSTDGRGNFRIPGLHPGTYRIAAVTTFQDSDPKNYPEDGPDGVSAENLATYSGNTFHRSAATRYEVHSGDEVSGIEITIPISTLHTVGGTLSGKNGLTPNIGRITLHDTTDDGLLFRTSLDTDGSFLLRGIPSGTYEVVGEHVFVGAEVKVSMDYSTLRETVALADTHSSVVVADNDVLDLHFDLPEVPLPPLFLKTAPEAVPPPKPLPTGRIALTVLCADTRKPARSAAISVYLFPDGDSYGQEKITGADGTYTFNHLAPGRYGIIVEMGGYLRFDTGRHPGNQPNQVLTVHPGETVPYTVLLHRGVAMSGHVAYADGSPAPNTAIRILDLHHQKQPTDALLTHPNQVFGSGNLFKNSTDDLGNFHLYGLAPGRYRVAAVPQYKSWEDLNSTLGIDDADDNAPHYEIEQLAIYAGDTVHEAASPVFELKYGEEAHAILITIPLSTVHTVRGTIKARDGRVINLGMATMVDTKDPQILFRTLLQTDGFFEFHTVPTGTYALTLSNSYIQVTVPGSDDHPDHAERIKTNAFADQTESVIVKDSDISDLRYQLNEVPLPPTPKQQDSQVTAPGTPEIP